MLDREHEPFARELARRIAEHAVEVHGSRLDALLNVFYEGYEGTKNSDGFRLVEAFKQFITDEEVEHLLRIAVRNEDAT